MNILFVYSVDAGILPDGTLSSQELIQFGISQIASCLNRRGHLTELVVTGWKLGHKSDKRLAKAIDVFRPRLICLTAVATQYDYIASLARTIKKEHPGIFLLLGGVHPTLNPDESLKDAFDALCIGEGEEATVELAAQLEEGARPAGIRNLWIRNGSSIEKNPQRPFIQDLDALPFPDRSMWQRWMSDPAPRMCSILLSRGCPFDCSYCSNHALRKISPGTYLRHRSPENITAEIRDILDRFPSVNEIYLETETLLANREWCAKLCAHLEDLNRSLKSPLSFGANIRIVPGAELESVFAMMKRSHFRFINIGLESGSERVRRAILRRNYANADVIEAVRLARKYGIQVALFNLIGVPGETFTDFKETVRMNKLCRPDWHLTSIFFPYPGTDLYRSAVAQGLIQDPIDPRNERQKASLDLPDFPRKKILDSLRFFNHYVYKGFNPDNRAAVWLAYFCDVTVKRAPKRLLRHLKMKLHNLAYADRKKGT